MKLLISLLFFSLSSFSQDFLPDVELGEPSFSGSGCNPYEASAVLSPDKKVLSILFDNFIVEAGDGLAPSAQKVCQTQVPINVPQNFQVAIITLDYRGFEYIPLGSRTSIRTEYNFQNGSNKTRTLAHSKSKMGKGEDDEYFLSTKLGTQNAKFWSHCGKNTTLNIKTTLQAHANRTQDPVLITIDSADSSIDQGMQYFLEYRPCESSHVSEQGYGNTQGGNYRQRREDARRRQANRCTTRNC